MKKYFLFTFVLFCGLVPTAMGQYQISGQIKDAATGNSLQSATIQIQETTHGTITNQEGRFLITLSRIPSVLVVRHIGYHTATRTIESADIRQIVIELEPAPVVLNEIVVSGEDPALEIMRNVLRRKSEWRVLYQSSYAEVYTRFWLFREFDPIQVRESVRSEYWKKGIGNREIVQARRIRPAANGSFRFAGPEYVPNFYDDTVSIRGTEYATPLHPDALDLYRFRLGGQRPIDRTVVWDIYFTPKSGMQASFTGHIAVRDSSFSVLELDVRPEPPTVVTPPVQSFDIRYQQHYVGLEGGIMVPIDLQTRGSVTFGRLGATYPPARFEQVSSVSNYSLDAPVPDSMYLDDRTERLHPMVDNSEFLFIRNPTIIPLTPRETESFTRLDPRMTVERAFRPDGFLRNYTAFDVVENEPGEEIREGGIVGDLIRNSWVWYNRVDGWHPGLQYKSRNRSGFATEGRLGYASEFKKLSLGLELALPISAGTNSVELYAVGEDQTRATAKSQAYGAFLSGFMTYLGYDDYSDYYRNRSAAVGIRLVPESSPIEFDVHATHGEHSSVSKHSDFNGWWFRNVQRDNPEIENGLISSVNTRFKIGSEHTYLSANVERAFPNVIESDFDFAKFESSASVSVPTFFKDRDRPNRLSLSFRGSTFSGSLPPQRYALVDGSTGFYASENSFRTFQQRPVVGKQVAAIFWEHDFTTSLMEALGFWGLAQQGWGVTIFGAHSKIWDVVGSTAGSEEFHELGFSIKYPFRLPLRLDFAARLNSRVFSVSLGRIRI